MNCQERCSSTLPVRHVPNQHISILADRLAHPAQHPKAAARLQDQRPQHHEPVLAVHGHDGQRQLGGPGARWQIVIGPVPIPVERLEQLGVAAGALEQIVPFRLECIEPGPVADDRKAVRTGAGAGQG